jgi:hypothetical protein
MGPWDLRSRIPSRSRDSGFRDSKSPVFQLQIHESPIREMDRSLLSLNHEVQTLGASGSHDPEALESYSFLHKGSRPGLHEPSDGSRAIIPDLNRVSGKGQHGYKVYGVILGKEYSQGAFPEYYEKLSK